MHQIRIWSASCLGGCFQLVGRRIRARRLQELPGLNVRVRKSRRLAFRWVIRRRHAAERCEFHSDQVRFVQLRLEVTPDQFRFMQLRLEVTL